MFQENLREETQNKILGNSNLIVVAICTALCMIFMKTGFFSLVFLAPLGYAVLVSGSVWITFFAVAAANLVISALLNLLSRSTGNFMMEIFYFSSLFLAYIWAVGGKNLRSAYRFMIAAAAGSLAFFFFIWVSRGDIAEILAEMSQILSSVLVSSNEAFEVFTSDRVLEMMQIISVRGGIFVSMLFMLFLNRQLALGALRFMKKDKNIRFLDLDKFVVPSNIIWYLTITLAVVVITSLLRIEILEILSWNVLVAGIILFMVQGTGVVMHLLSKRSSFFRIAFAVLLFFLLISPLGFIAIIALFILGVAENWLSLRKKPLVNSQTG
ncbi:MAG: hypothetical protein FWD26_06240 [Treponema sp.]|nr:hypothetical protein [Treponema sp.]